MKPNIQHSFAQIPKAEIQRSQFNRSHGHKTTFNAGDLIPIFLDEALPGDTFNLKMSCFARMATPIAPIMDNLYLDTFFFAVPYRLVWDNWQKFNGEQVNPGDSTDYLVPIVASGGTFVVGSLADYFGLPVGVTNLTTQNAISALPWRSYSLIWNEWFRDQNLQNSITIPKGDGPDQPVASHFIMRKRGKRHDYFTSCLPWPQKGPSVTLPLGTSAPVIPGPFVSGSGPSQVYNTSTGALITGTYTLGTSTPGLSYFNNTPTGVVANAALGLKADLSAATAATINQLRQSFQIQKLYERDARGGTRYIEIIKSHFGVTSPDARLQRPEYLGGGSAPINIHPIAQTSSTDAVTPQGNLAAMGTVSANGHGFVKSFTEHCIVMGLACVRADLNYQKGLNKMWSRRTRFDFYWPALSHIGEQAVLNKEIYAQGTSADDNVFGYQERYAEYRYKPSIITGQFRSGVAGSLDLWHLAQNFTSLPTLSDSFIQENPPVSRVIAVPSQPQFLFDSHFDLKCARPMPVYSVPGLIDHF